MRVLCYLFGLQFRQDARNLTAFRLICKTFLQINSFLRRSVCKELVGNGIRNLHISELTDR